MPEKEQRFRLTKFPPEALRSALEIYWVEAGMVGEDDPEGKKKNMFYIPPSEHRARSVTSRRVEVTDDEVWNFDTDDEFYAEYRRDIYEASFGGSGGLHVSFHYPNTNVTVRLAARESVVRVFEVFERYRE